MNYLIQRGKVRGQVLQVPEGLPELLSDITREVLRCQPIKECLCQFIIDYLHSVIMTRKKAMVAKVIIDHALEAVDEIISELCICNISKDKADQMVLVIEDCFKRFLEQHGRREERKEKEIVNLHEIGILDELIRRCKFSEDELKISRPLIEAALERFKEAYMATEDTEGTDALHQYFKERELRRMEQLQMNRAATRIQACFRGYAVRRSMFLKKTEGTFLVNVTPSQLEEMQRAAIKIQRFYRLHGTHNNQSLILMHYCGEEREYAYADLCHPSAQSVLGEKKLGEICSNASLSSMQVKMFSYTASEDIAAPPNPQSEQELTLATTYVSKPSILIEQEEVPESPKPQVVEPPTVEPEAPVGPEADPYRSASETGSSN